MNNYRKYLGEEDILQEAVIKYVYYTYRVKAIPMNTEHKKSRFECYKSKVLGNYKGIVDLFIPYPNKHYNGLFIELKTEGRKVFKKDGTLYANGKETHEAQLKELERLNKLGYLALMVFGFDEVKKVLDKYFK